MNACVCQSKEEVWDHKVGLEKNVGYRAADVVKHERSIFVEKIELPHK